MTFLQLPSAMLKEHAQHVRAFAKTMPKTDQVLFPAVTFDGQTSLFREGDAWHLRLTGGDLREPVRLEPRKDSTTAHRLADFALAQHVQDALPEVVQVLIQSLPGEWIQASSEAITSAATGIVQIARHGASVVVDLGTHHFNAHYGGEGVRAVIFPTARGVELHYLGQASAKALEHYSGALSSAARTLMKFVPEYFGVRLLVIDPVMGEVESQLEEVSIHDYLDRWSLSAHLGAGLRIGTVMANTLTNFGARMAEGVLVSGQRNAVFTSAQDDLLSDFALKAITMRGGTSVEVRHTDHRSSVRLADHDLVFGVCTRDVESIDGYLRILGTGQQEMTHSAIAAFCISEEGNVRVVLGAHQGELDWVERRIRNGLQVIADEVGWADVRFMEFTDSI